MVAHVVDVMQRVLGFVMLLVLGAWCGRTPPAALAETRPTGRVLVQAGGSWLVLHHLASAAPLSRCKLTYISSCA